MSWRAESRRLRKFGSGWPAVAVCALLVLLAGSRLVFLSMQQHAAASRSTAQGLADRSAQALRAQLQGLVRLAQQRAATGGSVRPAEGARAVGVTAIGSAAPGFRIGADGQVSGVAPSEVEIARDLEAEWSAQPAGGRAPSVIGPVREGSRWLVAARAPLAAAGDGGQAQGWAVVYQDLDVLLVAAEVDRAARAGYDFELSRFATPDARALPVVSSAAGILADPVTSAIQLPAPAGAADAWSLALRPRSGWFPPEELIVDVSLLLLVTWLVALGVRDAAHHLVHLRTALAVSRKRLQNTQQNLSREIELRQRLQRSFEHAHYHDSFTGLPNRHFFLGQVDRALRDMRTRAGYRIAVMLIAVDRFKVITDTLGHTAGDELVVQVTRLFDRALSGQEHVLARWADDELALLLADASRMPLLIETVQALQQELQAPLMLRRHRIVIATSIGATQVESGLARAEEVMREADVALSSARSAGGSNLVTYSPMMQNQFMQIVSLEGDLHMALEREEFRLRFQPIVNLHGGKIVGVEALLRWMHPLEGLLPPGRFLSFAEEAGLIVPITRWTITRACKLAAYWRQRLPAGRAFFISINLSAAALLDPGLSEHVGEALRESGVPAATLKFELTENGLISNVGAARDVLDRLHAMGIELMLDDFGTGYSSLSHLQLFPFSYIKIDGPLGSQLGSQAGGGDDGALVRAMAQMAATLGLKTIAEIVERTAAVEALTRIGCQFAQGNVFCGPVDAEQALQRLLAEHLEPRDQPEEEVDSSPTLILPIIPEAAVQ
jgi:diguanylate cyclase (GGDEF)-like protein